VGATRRRRWAAGRSALSFGVHADHRLTGSLVVFDLLVEVAELGIAVGMLGTFEGLGIGLQAETLLDEQLAHRRRRDAVTLPGQLFSQVPQRLSRPPQRRHRIPAFVRLDQRQQRRHQTRILRSGALATPAPAAHPLGRQGILAAFEFEHTLAHGRSADPGHLRHRPHSAMTQQPGLGGQHQPLLALVQMRQQHLESGRQLIPHYTRDTHTRSTNAEPEKNTLILYGFDETSTESGSRRESRSRWP
jgi:hypothetical protein